MTTRNTPATGGSPGSKGVRRSTTDSTTATAADAPVASEVSSTPSASSMRSMSSTGFPGQPQESGSLVDRMKERASAQLTSQVNRATEGLGSVASAVKGATQQLRANNQETAARIVEKTAEQIERFSTRLREKDLGELVRDAERLARRNPAMFIGGAFALGIVASRFLKSSTDRNRDEYTRGTYGRAY